MRRGGIEVGSRGNDCPQRTTAASAVTARPAHSGNFFRSRCTPRDGVTNGLVGGSDAQTHVHQQTSRARSLMASRVIGITGEGAEHTGRILAESNLSR